jgi:integrase
MSDRGSVYLRNGKWVAHVTWRDADGKRRQRKTSHRTRKEAEQGRTELLRAVDTATAVAPARDTVDGYLVGWLEHLELVVGRKPSTVDSYRKMIRRYVSPAIGSKRLQVVTATEVDDLYREMVRRGLSARSVRYVHSILRRAFGDAHRKDLVATNVVVRTSPPSTVSAKAPTFTTWSADELGRFLADIEGRERVESIVFAALTGARRGEIVGLRWSDVDLDRRTALIACSVVVVGGAFVEGDTKTHRARPVSLDDALVAMLRRHRVAQAEWRLRVGSYWIDRGLVFPGPDGDYEKPDTLSQRFERLVASVDVPRIRFHDLRHTHATLLVEAGVDPKAVSERLGHSTVAFTLDHYVHPTLDQQRAAAELFAGLLRQARRGGAGY